MPLELPSSYSAAAVEADVYRRWETAGCFKAGAGKRDGQPSYTIAIPPPNVTGVLHMGHALNNTLQDTLIRWRRMQGYDTLWQPGTDHAGIATESVVVKQVQEQGLTRDGLGREEFLKRVWAWKEQSGGAIINQLRKLGSSCDWSRERFTMDEGLTHAVRVQFKQLYDAGLIYKGTRMVNWCPVQKTALADDEVEVIEKNGHLWALKYELVDGSGSITVETTRPETFFGDTAVAVNPADARYQHLIGKLVRLPIIGREIPIVADDYANPDKGSGAVKITPAHDPNDYELGKRHNLPLIRVIDFDGTMTRDCAQFAGMERFAARKALLKEFEATGVLLGSTEIMHAVGHSYRSNAPIEPMVTEQWFVAMKSLADRALLENQPGGVEFHPERWAKVYAHWLENVRDWCISRQIWWGHRIPAWHCATCGKHTVAIAEPTACEHCGSTQITQDSDVLDTWFSSALWPFSTLGWPEATPEMARYFPTSTLVTDRGIIFFLVARMVMASCFALDKKPFSDVYIHGTVLDERGTKMSKSLGNFVSADNLFEQDPRGLAIRYYLLTAHYRANLEYHDGVLAEAKTNIRGIESFVKRALSLIAPALESPSAFLQNDFDFDLLPADFVAAMNDDLNVPAALAVLHEAIRAGNSAVDSADINVATEQLGATIMMCKALNVYPFDVNASGEAVWPTAEASAELKSKIEQLVADRLAAKAAKDFARADAIRDELTNLGVTLEDSTDKTNWSVN